MMFAASRPWLLHCACRLAADDEDDSMASKITLPSVHVNAPSNEVVVGVVVAVVVVGVVVVVCVVVCDLYRAPWWQRHARCERASAYNAQEGHRCITGCSVSKRFTKIEMPVFLGGEY